MQASSLRDKPNNRRTLLENYSRQRGPILVAGKPVARSVPTDDELKYVRQYTDAELYAHLTGYYSFVYGAGAGIERSENDLLSGSVGPAVLPPGRRRADRPRDRRAPRSSSPSTPPRRRPRPTGLGNQRGAVVALDPRTGAILAMASNPTYDPNDAGQPRPGARCRPATSGCSRTTTTRWSTGRSSALYPPGSTFKVVTAAAALSSGKYTEHSVRARPGRPRPAADHREPAQRLRPARCGPGDKVDLTRALEISCNTAFASLGLALGDDALRRAGREVRLR